MKRISWIIAVALVVSLAGCQYSDRRKASMEMNVMSIRFQKLVEKGQTTPEQQKAYIKAVSDMALQLDRSVRGTTKANQTRQNATVAADTGVDPSAPVKLERGAK